MIISCLKTYPICIASFSLNFLRRTMVDAIDGQCLDL